MSDYTEVSPNVKVFTGHKCSVCQKPIALIHVIVGNTHAVVQAQDVSGEGGERTNCGRCGNRIYLGEYLGKPTWVHHGSNFIPCYGDLTTNAEPAVAAQGQKDETLHQRVRPVLEAVLRNDVKESDGAHWEYPESELQALLDALIPKVTAFVQVEALRVGGSPAWSALEQVEQFYQSRINTHGNNPHWTTETVVEFVNSLSPARSVPEIVASGEYNCLACGLKMSDPCEHWLAILDENYKGTARSVEGLAEVQHFIEEAKIEAIVQALGDVLVKAGVLNGEATLTVPQLLLAAETFCAALPGSLPSPVPTKPIDGKFGILGDKLVNLVSGEPIPEDEPLFLIRARDHHAIRLLKAYNDICAEDCNNLHMAGIKQTIDKFATFTAEHPERMKQPGKTRHLKLDPSGHSLPSPVPQPEWSIKARDLLKRFAEWDATHPKTRVMCMSSFEKCENELDQLCLEARELSGPSLPGEETRADNETL